MNKTTRVVAVGAVIVALTVILGWMPVVFLVPTLFACCAFGWKMSIFASTTFGVISLAYSFMMPSSPVSLAFINNPLIPILARIAVGIIAHGFFVAFNKFFDEKKKWIIVMLTAVVGSIMNTVLVGTCLLIFEPDIVLKGISIGYLLIMGSIEAVVNAVIVPPVFLTTKKHALGAFVK